MPLAIPTVKLDPKKSRPTVEVVFGDTNVGNYRCFRWDPKGKTAKTLAHGNNVDEAIDKFTLDKDAVDLTDDLISYEVIIQAPEARAGQLYSVMIMIRQDGDLCEQGLIQQTGQFTDAKALIGFRRFAA
jgi:hypothetical protein